MGKGDLQLEGGLPGGAQGPVEGVSLSHECHTAGKALVGAVPGRALADAVLLPEPG